MSLTPWGRSTLRHTPARSVLLPGYRPADYATGLNTVSNCHTTVSVHRNTGKVQHKYGMKGEKTVPLYREGTAHGWRWQDQMQGQLVGGRPRSLQKQSSCLEHLWREAASERGGDGSG